MQYIIKYYFDVGILFISDQLPTKTDSQQLTYCVATIQEVLRISTIAVAAAPHVSTKDVVISGYYFPKGTLFFANLRKYLKDPAVFPNPMEFVPERFIATHQESDDSTPTLKVCNYFYFCLI